MKKLLIIIWILFIHNKLSAQKIIRGPYLQMGGSNTMTIRWATDVISDGFLEYGTDFNKKDIKTEISESNLEFEFTLKNLKPATKYYYSAKSPTRTYVSDSTHYFITSPEKGKVGKYSFVAFGDCGTLTQGQRDVYSQVQKYYKNKPIDGWLLLGDNAYNYGYLREYQVMFFDVYNGGFMKNTVLRPAPGNHDYYALNVWPAGQLPDYFHIFNLPTKGESGGVASNNEAYYSYDHGNVHFVSLDSYGVENGLLMSDSLSKQVEWLKKDLEANTLPWKVVYFHHPPYTKGSHDSDTELDLVKIRENLVKVLEKYKVDLVLNGHSHNYERSYLMQGHYGNETSFSLTKHAVSSSSARYDGSINSCPYIKKDSGTVYVIAGTAGWVGGTKPGYPHNAMVYSNSEDVGAAIIDVEDNKLTLKYLTGDGVIKDNFVIFKDVNIKSEKEIDCGQVVELKPSWSGKYFWDNGIKTASNLKVDSLASNKIFIVTDSLKCLKDEFKINVRPFPAVTITSNSPVDEGKTLTISSNATFEGEFTWTDPKLNIVKSKNFVLEKIKPDNAGVYKFTGKFKNCVSTSSLNVEVIKYIPPLGLEIENKLKVSAYPNPTKGELRLKINSASEQKCKIIISDILGNKYLEIEDLNLSKGENYINLSELNLRSNTKTLILSLLGERFKESVKVILE